MIDIPWSRIGPILLLAFAVRLAVSAFYLGLQTPKGWDFEQYENTALNLLCTGDYLTERTPVAQSAAAYRPPLYPFFLAGFFGVFGHVYAPLKIAQSLLGAVTVLIVYALALLIFDKKVGILSAVLFAVYPPLVFYAGYLGTETLFIFLLMAAVLALVWANLRGRVPGLVTSGALVGLSVLCRPTALPFVVLFPAWLIFREGLHAESVKRVTAFVVTSLIVISVWSVRNYLVFDRFVPLTTATGVTLWRGVGDGARGAGSSRFAQLPPKPDGMGEVDFDRYLTRLSVEKISSAPLRFFKLGVKKVLWTWRLYPEYRGNAFREVLHWVSYYPLLILGFYGIWLTRGRWRDLLLLYFVPMNFTIVHFVFISDSRYRLPAMPFLMLFAAIAIVSLSGRMRLQPVHGKPPTVAAQTQGESAGTFRK